MIRRSASILLVAFLSAPALVAQGAPQGRTTQSLAGKWKVCIVDEGRTGCGIVWEIKVTGDAFAGTATESDGLADQIVQGRIQGDHVGLKTGFGCTDGTPAPPGMQFHTPTTTRKDNCTVVITSTYRGGDEWTGTVDDTDNHHQKAFTATRVTGKS